MVWTIVDYLLPNPFLYIELYFKQFSLVYVLFFIYTQLNIKTFPFQTIQFSISTQFKWKSSSISNS